MRRWLMAMSAGGILIEPASAAPQNPSPMVEHTRPHERLVKRAVAGERHAVDPGQLFVPKALSQREAMPLLVFFHGGDWVPELAAESGSCAILRVQRAAGYAGLFEADGEFGAWLERAARSTGCRWTVVTVGGWSAGCAAVRDLLRRPAEATRIDRIILIDGLHCPYTNGKPGPLESSFDTTRLDGVVEFARSALAGGKRLLIVHGEIFPGTFASTTETADWLVRRLDINRSPVLRWGPMGTQQLSEARRRGFCLAGFAGNSAPDHVDLLHALPEWLRWLERN